MIYVSGRIDIYNFERYRSQFMSAREYLEHEVTLYQDNDVVTLFEKFSEINTAIHGLSNLSMSDEWDLRIGLVRNCDKLYLLQGWDVDDMCRAEWLYAKAKNKKIILSKKY